MIGVVGRSRLAEMNKVGEINGIDQIAIHRGLSCIMLLRGLLESCRYEQSIEGLEQHNKPHCRGKSREGAAQPRANAIQRHNWRQSASGERAQEPRNSGRGLRARATHSIRATPGGMNATHTSYLTTGHNGLTVESEIQTMIQIVTCSR